MNATESVALCRYVKAACPQQAMDEYTPQAWYDLLGHLRYEDTREAAKNLAQRQPFIAPSEIITETRRIRDKRTAAGDADLIPPPYESPEQYRAWMLDARRRLADGETAAEINGPRGVLTSGPKLQLIGRRIPNANTARRVVKTTKETTA